MDRFLVNSPHHVSPSLDGREDAENIDFVSQGDQIELRAPEALVEETSGRVMDLDENAHALDNVSTSSQESLNEVVPVSNKSYENSYNKFQHSKNISLDGSSIFGLKLSHRSKLSTSSIVSFTQDPPVDNINKSASNNTLYSVDSVNQLSSISLDSPPSLTQVAQLQKHKPQMQPIQNTPRKQLRNKSSSCASSHNFNLYKTPSRNVNSVNLSPVNLGLSGTGSKVLKTPHSQKKGHTRSRSRVSVELSGNPSAYLSNQMPISQKSNFQENDGVDPFYSSFVSPRIDGHATTYDDIQTPASHFNSRARSESNLALSNTGNLFLSPIPNNWGYVDNFKTMETSKINESEKAIPFKGQLTNNTQSFEIEDQDDDALKALKKIRSYSNFGNFNKSAKPLEHSGEGVSGKIAPLDSKDDSLFSSAADASWKLAANMFPNSYQNIDKVDTEVLHGADNYDPGISSQDAERVLEDTKIRSALSGMRRDTFNMENELSFNPYGFGAPTVDLLLPLILNSNIPSSSAEYQGVNFAESNPQQQNKKFSSASIDLSNMSAPASEPLCTYNPPLGGLYSFNGGMSTLLPFSAPNLASELTQNAILAQNLKLPIKMVDNTANFDPKKKHACPLCQARFQRPEHVKRHMKSHSSEKPYECDEPNCGKRFNRKDNLKAHLKKIHQRKV